MKRHRRQRLTREYDRDAGGDFTAILGDLAEAAVTLDPDVVYDIRVRTYLGGAIRSITLTENAGGAHEEGKA